MFIQLYKNVNINYDNNDHLYFTSEADFISFLQGAGALVEAITYTDSQNFIPNGKEFALQLTNRANEKLVNYIIWYDGYNYRHYRVISYDEYASYCNFKCESDLWADAIYSRNFGAFIKLKKSNQKYTENNATIPYYYDSINYTNSYFSQYNKQGVASAGNITTFTKTYLVAFDKQVETFSGQTLLFGATWESVIARFNEADLDKIKNLISTASGDKIRLKAIYILPFKPTDEQSAQIEVQYKGQPSGSQLFVYKIKNGTYYTNMEISDTVFDGGNRKVYVGAGDSLMLIESIAPTSYINYRFIIDDYSVTAYVAQGDNSKDITDAYILKVTSNDATNTLQESLAKITGAGFKAVSGALMLTSPATVVGGLTSMVGAGIDLLPSTKTASYTLDGNAISTYLNPSSTGFNYRTYTAINNMKDNTRLYGVNYNWYTSFTNALKNGSFIVNHHRIYLQAEVLELIIGLSVEQYNFIKSELERGIYFVNTWS